MRHLADGRSTERECWKETTRYTLDYAAGNRILAESTPTETVSYLYGHDCAGSRLPVGEQREGE